MLDSTDLEGQDKVVSDYSLHTSSSRRSMTQLLFCAWLGGESLKETNRKRVHQSRPNSFISKGGDLTGLMVPGKHFCLQWVKEDWGEQGRHFCQGNSTDKAWLEGRSSYTRMCRAFRALKLGLIRGARVGEIQPRRQQELDHKGFHLLTYSKPSFILEVLEATPGCEGRICNLM